MLLSFSLVVNLGVLGFFKYYNFFIDSWINLVQGLGYQFNSTTTLSIILPVGISFYTFQTLSPIQLMFIIKDSTQQIALLILQLSSHYFHS